MRKLFVVPVIVLSACAAAAMAQAHRPAVAPGVQPSAEPVGAAPSAHASVAAPRPAEAAPAAREVRSAPSSSSSSSSASTGSWRRRSSSRSSGTWRSSAPERGESRWAAGSTSGYTGRRLGSRLDERSGSFSGSRSGSLSGWRTSGYRHTSSAGSSSAGVRTPGAPDAVRLPSRSQTAPAAMAQTGVTAQTTLQAQAAAAKHAAALKKIAAAKRLAHQKKLAAARRASQANSIARTLGAAGAGLVFLLKLGLVLVLAYLTVVALKLFWNRSGRPLQFGKRSLVVEESAPLGVGTAIHVVHVGGRRMLVGTAQGQINILQELDAETADAQPSLQPVAPANAASPLAAVKLPAFLEKLTRREAPGETAAAGVASELRRSAQFIDEIRARMAGRDA